MRPGIGNGTRTNAIFRFEKSKIYRRLYFETFSLGRVATDRGFFPLCVSFYYATVVGHAKRNNKRVRRVKQ